MPLVSHFLTLGNFLLWFFWWFLYAFKLRWFFYAHDMQTAGLLAQYKLLFLTNWDHEFGLMTTLIWIISINVILGRVGIRFIGQWTWWESYFLGDASPCLVIDIEDRGLFSGSPLSALARLLPSTLSGGAEENQSFVPALSWGQQGRSLFSLVVPLDFCVRLQSFVTKPSLCYVQTNPVWTRILPSSSPPSHTLLVHKPC